LLVGKAPGDFTLFIRPETERDCVYLPESASGLITVFRAVQIGRNLDTQKALISAVTRVSPAPTTEQKNH
jgi:hypothetical protein